MTNKRMRIYLIGVGGLGSLTATTLLASTALDQGMEVVSGEIHGMAQRGGVVHSTVLVGGFKSPVIAPGEADLILGFEPMETLRGLPYLKKGGIVLSSTDPIPSPGVSAGRETYPDMEMIKSKINAAAGKTWFMSTRAIGEKVGSIQSGNTALIGAMCATGLTPFTVDMLRQGVRKFMNPKIQEVNLKAVDLGVAAVK